MNQSLSEFLTQCLTEKRLQRFHDVLAHRTRFFTVVLENIYHEHNASACLRTCDCFGIQDVHIIEAKNSFKPNPDIALGASKWLTTYSYRAPKTETTTPGSDNAGLVSDDSATVECIQHLRQQGYRILATSPRQDSMPLNDLTVDTKAAIVFGAEQLGVSDTAIASADELVHVPMFGFTESFNISVSVAIILHQLVSLLRRSDIDWQLTPDEHQIVLDQWVRRSLGPQFEPLCRRYYAEHPGADQSSLGDP